MTTTMADVASSPCVICGNEIEGTNFVVLGQKGAQSINESSAKRGDSICVATGSKLHATCRKQYTHKYYIDKKQKDGDVSEPVNKKPKRDSFNVRNHCLYCGTPVSKTSEYSSVKAKSFSKSIIDCCSRRNDEWSHAVRGRLAFFDDDICASQGVYHRMCDVYFRQGHAPPTQYQLEETTECIKQPGRPIYEDLDSAFFQVCGFLEQNLNAQITLSSLSDKMREYLSDSNSTPYGTKHLKRRLLEHYGESVFFSNGDGKTDIVMLQNTASNILRLHHNIMKDCTDDEAVINETIEATAKLILDDIKASIPAKTDEYPDLTQMTQDDALEYVPKTLRRLLTLLFSGMSCILNLDITVANIVILTCRR